MFLLPSSCRVIMKYETFSLVLIECTDQSTFAPLINSSTKHPALIEHGNANNPSHFCNKSRNIACNPRHPSYLKITVHMNTQTVQHQNILMVDLHFISLMCKPCFKQRIHASVYRHAKKCYTLAITLNLTPL